MFPNVDSVVFCHTNVYTDVHFLRSCEKMLCQKSALYFYTSQILKTCKLTDMPTIHFFNITSNVTNVVLKVC